MLEPYFIETQIEVGVDEAGAGCLAGPVFAAAVIWPTELPQEAIIDSRYKLIKDSKKLNKKNRELARDFIIEYCISYSIQSIDHKYIDEHNILNSRIKAMHVSIDNINIVPDFILVDGNRFKKYYTENNHLIDYKCFIKGDNKYISIAAASILAKTSRDDYMVNVAHELYPQYQFDTHKGYGTKKHYDAIKNHGVCPIHRLSFRLT
jgi:ribonuclease HII